MPLTLTPTYGTAPYTIYSDINAPHSPLMLTVTGFTNGVARQVTWTLEKAPGISVQQGASGSLVVAQDNTVLVPIVTTEPGSLTLTLTDVSDPTNWGSLPLTSVVLDTFTVTASPNSGKLGSTVTFTASLIDTTTHEPLDGAKLNWSSSQTGVIPTGATPRTTNKADPSTYQLITSPLKDSMLDTNQAITVTLRLGDYGFPVITQVPVNRTLLSPELVIPLVNNTIDDGVIDAFTKDGYGGIPFKIPEIKNYTGGAFIVLCTGSGDFLDVAPLNPVGKQIWPLLMKANTEDGAFDYTGPMAVFYYYIDTLGSNIKGISSPLNLQIRRKNFPSPSPIDLTLPRPKVSTTAYAKADLDAAKDLVVTIPLILDKTQGPIFKSGDTITVKITLKGYTSANEGRVTRRTSGPKILTDTDVAHGKTSLTISIPSKNFAQIDGSIGNISYTLRRSTAGLSSQLHSPNQALTVDTVEAYSSGTAFQISTMAVLVSQL